jgi:monooxygenase
MVQRSPSYILSMASHDGIADRLRRRLPAKAAYTIVRWKNVLLSLLNFTLSRRTPRLVKALLRRGVVAQLPAGYDVATHFTPRYNPWDQRLCLVPDGDLFTAIRSGKASVLTEQTESFTERGIRLASGAELEADIVVTATGLNLLTLGGASLRVDGVDVDLGKTVAYKGMMLSGVPNFAMTIGYTNASWTLKADLVARYVCRVLNHCDRHGYSMSLPVAPESTDLVPLIDFSSGYVLRSIESLPKQGTKAPWRLRQNYPRDLLMMRYGSVKDEGIRFMTTSPEPVAAQALTPVETKPEIPT